MEINYLGLGIVMLSSIFYALYIVIVNKSKIQASGFKLSFYSMLFTSGFFMAKAILENESFIIPSVNIFVNFLILLFLLRSFQVCAWYMQLNIGSTPAAILGALEPVVAVLISVLLFHEKFTFNLFLGIILILIGVILNVISESKKSIEIQKIKIIFKIDHP
jgi:drug/metabolite transporter (DMT)-like permease